MELTIEKALQLGVTAHKEGRFQEAERLYRAILQTKPEHPDANYNLGLLAINVNRPDAALPLLKNALHLNPKMEKFWISYIDALIKDKQYSNAKKAIKNARKHGVNKKLLNSLKEQIPLKTENHKILDLSPPQELVDSLLVHYQQGQLLDTERIAVSLTKQFPKYQLGWKVLGAAMKQAGKTSASLVPSQKSVQLAPEDAEAHNNLGVTLQELGKLDEAEASYNRAICLKSEYFEAHFNLAITLQELGRLEKAERSYAQSIALRPKYVEAHYNLANNLKKQGKLDEAEASYKQTIVLKPDHIEAHNNLGVTLQELGKLDEAQASFKQAIALQPKFFEAFYNLGNSLKLQGKLEEAEASHKQSIAINPDCVEAHYNLGGALKAQGKLDEAQASYKQTIILKPDHIEAHNNLGVTLQELGKLEEAVASYLEAIELDSNFLDAYINLGQALKNQRFKSSNRKLYAPLLHLLTRGNYVRPEDLADCILSLLKCDLPFKDLFRRKNLVTTFTDLTSIIGSLNDCPLLHHLMRTCLLPDLQFEKFFLTIRNFLLMNLELVEVSSEIVYFLSSLSIHCFNNEYVYVEVDEESELVEALEADISETIAHSGQMEIIKVLCFASYRPLHQYDWCKNLKVLDHLEEVKKRLIEEPLAEKSIAKKVASLGNISDIVSCKVRDQYEKNPYPRWVKLFIPAKMKSISAVVEELNLRLQSNTIKLASSPDILIAGCGTGQHSITTASRFFGCKVTAVDLSSRSLAYAQRKTDELCLKNIKYLQADILNLDQLNQDFDIIESSGVLHHMDEPLIGWKGLTDILKPGGLMNIGLYSQLARQHVERVRTQIKSAKIGITETEIRGYRQLLAVSQDIDHKLITQSTNFYSLSMLRDLLFHVQEHQFTLPRIKDYLDELGLSFCGFENKYIISSFRQFHGRKADIYDLTLWDQYEKNNPQAFVGMYQFWCQKV